ncbi:uncharacterized protein PITG_02101 [Phytophthora infestans T30-4]|uniref:Uncharacterized protein n=1 Tax=Phytophthora infestans (strain T30-4) TaxID=403677 RepID=D0MVH3_PHYIT|nr:uncharacterized protein PITG_02101 [Phytophthora infestans T30-4]EEY63636.1 hypothetical protein PITG_02101 [Phytophthora infestans T30-4]|eukprot:XP_002907072.1 hypothetical protein PITG_02101 [Phytophthora infestans T30-4]
MSATSNREDESATIREEEGPTGSLPSRMRPSLSTTQGLQNVQNIVDQAANRLGGNNSSTGVEPPADALGSKVPATFTTEELGPMMTLDGGGGRVMLRWCIYIQQGQPSPHHLLMDVFALHPPNGRSMSDEIVGTVIQRIQPAKVFMHQHQVPCSFNFPLNLDEQVVVDTRSKNTETETAKVYISTGALNNKNRRQKYRRVIQARSRLKKQRINVTMLGHSNKMAGGGAVVAVVVSMIWFGVNKAPANTRPTSIKLLSNRSTGVNMYDWFSHIRLALDSCYAADGAVPVEVHRSAHDEALIQKLAAKRRPIAPFDTSSSITIQVRKHCTHGSFRNGNAGSSDRGQRLTSGRLLKSFDFDVDVVEVIRKQSPFRKYGLNATLTPIHHI